MLPQVMRRHVLADAGVEGTRNYARCGVIGPRMRALARFVRGRHSTYTIWHVHCAPQRRRRIFERMLCGTRHARLPQLWLALLQVAVCEVEELGDLGVRTVQLIGPATRSALRIIWSRRGPPFESK